MKRLIGIIGVISVLAILVTSIPTRQVTAGNSFPSSPPAPVVASGSKVSSLLAMHVKVKKEQAAKGAKGRVKLFGVDSVSANETSVSANVTLSPADETSLASNITTDVNTEQVFLYFARKPTLSQIQDLNALGVTVYPGSWVPPVNNFQTGFVMADMPVGQLDALAAKSYIVSLDTAEQELQCQNDQARAAMNVDPVWSGGDTGAGVTVAVIDSGIDTSNPDFPALNSSNSKDYSNYPVLDDTITNTVTGHGTHVTGSLLGRGVNSPTYKGVAPGASLVFLKVGNDTDGSASSDAVIYALRDAVDVYHARIINISLGSWSEYHDGSDPVCQAVDYATSQGAAVFVAAGNDASEDWHDDFTVEPNRTTNEIILTVASGDNSVLPMDLVWNDGLGVHNNLRLLYYDSNHNLLPSTNSIQSESNKSGVECILSQLNTAVPSGTYYLRVQNSSSNQQYFHIYYIGGLTQVTFSHPDGAYTIDSPAEADSAIAVGAYVTRTNWTNYKGSNYTISPTESIGGVAHFSSAGPRVDWGGQGLSNIEITEPWKPNIVAPGSVIISARDPLYAPGNASYDPYIIDNDGQNLNGSSPANYYVMEGTSMASPMAAGVGALLLSKDPSLTPAQIRHTLELTATDIGVYGRDVSAGWGLINADAAINNNTSLGSYSDTIYSSLCNDFSSFASQHTVYLNGSPYLPYHIYQVAYYDGLNHLVADDFPTSDGPDATVFAGTGNLSSQHTFVPGIDKPGTWHVIVSEPIFSPPNTYNASWVYTIATDTFTVESSAISGSSNKLVFTSSAQTLIAGSASSIMTVQSQDSNGNPVNVTNDTDINLISTSTNGRFDTSAQGVFDGSITKVAIPAGGNQANFYYKDTKAGTSVITAVASIYSSGNQQETINASELAGIGFLTPGKTNIIAGQASGIITVQSQDIYGNAVDVASDTAVALTSSSNTGKFDIQAGGLFSSSTTSVTITSDSNSADFYYKDTKAGTAVITAASDSLTSSTQQETIIPDTPDIISLATPPLAGASVDTNLSTQPVILITDQYGNPISGVSVTASIGIGTASSLRGTVTRISSPGSGLATFTDLGYNKSGETFTIHFMAGSLTLDSDKLGPLSPGVATEIRVETAADGSGVIVGPQNLNSGSSLTVFGITRDEYGNYVSNPTNTVWSLTNKTGGMADTDISSHYGARVVMTGHLTGTAIIRAANGTLISLDSGTISVVQITNQKIAFTSYRNGDRPEIYIMNSDGSNQTRLTNGNDTGDNDFGATLSPDGTKIAFVSTRDNNQEIYVMNADGSSVVRLTNDIYQEDSPAWSPDGSKIAFYSNRDGIGNIYVMNGNGSNQTRITSNGGLEPTWSPDGSKIAFVSNRNSTVNIYTINIDGINERRITNESAYYINGVSWSPDGTRLVYGLIDGNWSSEGLFIIKVDGTDRIALPTTGQLQNACAPVWSPDGTKIAFSTTRYQPQEIYTANADGSDLVQLTNTDVTLGLERGNYGPSWAVGGWVAPTTVSGVTSNTFSNSATLSGSLINLGSATNVSVSFDWGTDTSYACGNIPGVPATLSAPGVFSANLFDLAPGQIYHYRAKAVGDGTVYGSDSTFIATSAPGKGKLDFITPAQTISAGSVSGNITIQTHDFYNNPINMTDDTNISLTSASSIGRFDISASGAFDGSINQVTIPAGSDSTTFYYKDIKAGSPMIIASGASYVSANQTETVVPAGIDHYAVSTIGPSVTVKTPFSLTINARDKYNNAITSGAEASEQVDIAPDPAKPDGGMTPTAVVTTGGTATIANLTMTAAQTGQTLTFTGETSGKTGVSNSFNVISNTPSPGGGGLGGGLSSGGGGGNNSSDRIYLSRYMTGAPGVFTSEAYVKSFDGLLRITFPKGTKGQTAQGWAVSYVILTPIPQDQQKLPLPENGNIIGLTYDLEPEGATFNPAATITMLYKDSQVPPGISARDLVIGYWDADGKQWVPLAGCVVDADNNTITAPLSHFSTYTILGYPPKPAPASFNLSGLTLSPMEALPGQEVRIGVTVSNTGGSPGSYTVRLAIDGSIADSREVTLDAGQSATIEFKASEDDPGQYDVDINGEASQFAVKAPTPSPSMSQALPTPSASPSLTPVAEGTPTPTRITASPATEPPAKNNLPLVWIIVGVILVAGLIGGIVLISRRAK